MKKGKRIATNVIISAVTQLITLALGLLLPRVILVNWGSEYNGLINSVSTIMRYLAILEAGIGTATLQALYKSLGEGDEKQTAIVLKTSQSFYRKVSVVYFAFVLVVSTLYPFFLKTTISYYVIFFVIFFQGLSGILNFVFRAAYLQLLNAEGKYYIISIITLFTTILTYAVKIVSIVVFDNILLMQALGIVVMIVQIVVYSAYLNKNYMHLLRMDVEPNISLLENRKHYTIQQVSGLVFNSTDTILLSIFCGLKIASVYTVYNLVYSALSTAVNIVRSSTNFVLGQGFHENSVKFEAIYNVYTSFQMVMGSFLSSCGILLIIGFIRIYTAGITDINYIDYIAAIMFSLNIILDCSRGASLAGTNIAGHAPKTTWKYILEALLNLVVSFSLVKSFGIRGVLLGTLVSGAWRSIDSIIYFNNTILMRSSKKELLFFTTCLMLFSCFAFMGSKDLLVIDSYYSFFEWGIVVTIVCFVIYGSLFYLANRTVINDMISLYKEKDN